MNNHNDPHFLDNNSGKGKPKLTAKQKRVLQNWREPATMRMVEARTEQIGEKVYNTTICGMIQKFKRLGLVVRVKNDHCNVSTFRADYFRLTPEGKKSISL